MIVDRRRIVAVEHKFDTRDYQSYAVFITEHGARIETNYLYHDAPRILGWSADHVIGMHPTEFDKMFPNAKANE